MSVLKKVSGTVLNETKLSLPPNSATVPHRIMTLIKTLAIFLLACNAQAFAPISRPISSLTSTTAMSATEKAFCVIVEAEIEPDRMAEFLKMIETNAIETRKEPGCLRFDVLRSQDQPNKFFFYELYKNVGAIDHHKKQKHYQAWTEFKESGGTISSVSHKNDGEFLP